MTNEHTKLVNTLRATLDKQLLRTVPICTNPRPELCERGQAYSHTMLGVTYCNGNTALPFYRQCQYRKPILMHIGCIVNRLCVNRSGGMCTKSFGECDVQGNPEIAKQIREQWEGGMYK